MATEITQSVSIDMDHVVVDKGGGAGSCGLATAVEESFWVRTKDGKYVRFVDTSVYNHNQMFRLFLSSKHGKTAILRVASPFAQGVNSR